MLLGVGQGCPLSTTLFILATDAINRYLEKCLYGMGTIIAYADDNAILVRDLFIATVILNDLLANIAGYTKLNLIFLKCIFMPLWFGGLMRLKITFCAILTAGETLLLTPKERSWVLYRSWCWFHWLGQRFLQIHFNLFTYCLAGTAGVPKNYSVQYVSCLSFPIPGYP